MNRHERRGPIKFGDVLPCPICASLVWLGDGSGAVAHLELHISHGGDEGAAARHHLDEIEALWDEA